MLQDVQALYKLIILFMLSKAAFPLSKKRVCDFILEKGYTNYIILNQAISELIDADMIRMQTINNRPHLSLTEEGGQTLRYFDSSISDVTKEEITEYMKANKVELRNEVSVTANYYKATSGEYEAHLSAKEKGVPLVEITLSVPQENTAASICDNWQKRNEEIYKLLVEKLF